jgi:hypothetical protein
MMKKIICACLIFGVNMAYSCAYAQQEEKLTISTFYPAPNGVYQTMRLKPGNAPVDAKPGQVYYNSTTDKIMYYNKLSNWSSLAGEGASSDTRHMEPNASYTGTPSRGNMFFNNTTRTIQFYNKTSQWVNVSGGGYWREGAFIPGPPNHTDVYLVNHTIRRVGIGTTAPTAALDVRFNDSQNLAQRQTVACFNTTLIGKGSQELTFDPYPAGTASGAYVANTSMIFADSSPQESLKLAAVDQNGSISFNVRGYNSSNSEVMRLTNPNTNGVPDPRVGIGNTSSPFALFVNSSKMTSVFAARNFQPQQGNDPSTHLRSGWWNLMPYGNRLYIMWGLFSRPGPNEEEWYVDQFKVPWEGGNNCYGSKIILRPEWGILLTSYLHCTGFDTTTGLIGTGAGSDWDVYNDTLFTKQGNWHTASSRSVKMNFAPLNQEEVLQKIDQLEVARWNYKSQGPSVTHIGPYAEDFYRQFKTGVSDDALGPMDEGGVTLAGVKALSERLNRQQQQIEGLRAAIKDMKSLLSRRR